MKIVTLNTKNIKSEKDFHAEFKKIMGFPDYYGMNWNAWDDCMGDLRDPDTGMVSIILTKDEMLYIQITNSEDFIKRLPNVARDFAATVAFVNQVRFVQEEKQKPAIALVLL